MTDKRVNREFKFPPFLLWDLVWRVRRRKMETRRRIADYSCSFIDFCPRLSSRITHKRAWIFFFFVSLLLLCCCCECHFFTFLWHRARKLARVASRQSCRLSFVLFFIFKFKFKFVLFVFHSGSRPSILRRRIFHAHGSSLVSVSIDDHFWSTQ